MFSIVPLSTRPGMLTDYLATVRPHDLIAGMHRCPGHDRIGAGRGAQRSGGDELAFMKRISCSAAEAQLQLARARNAVKQRLGQ
jgi:hypothetical protein